MIWAELQSQSGGTLSMFIVARPVSHGLNRIRIEDHHFQRAQRSPIWGILAG